MRTNYIEIISQKPNIICSKYAVLEVAANQETTHQNRKITFPGVNVLRNTNVDLNFQIKQLTYNM
jgi:hypothetical protein